MDRRKGTPDWLVDEGVELQPQPGPTGLAEVSSLRQRGTLAGFQDKHLASSAFEILGHCTLLLLSWAHSLPG